jgi:hypothetical protein
MHRSVILCGHWAWKRAVAREIAMIDTENAWDEYRGWAKRARTLQTSNRIWNTAALVAAVVAAVLGCAAGQVSHEPLNRFLSFLAAIAAALTPLLGRNILETKRETGWIRARATAEAIKSECFRYAAEVGDYQGSEGRRLFLERREKIINSAMREDLNPISDPANGQDKRCPPIPMSSEWYRKNRLKEQKDYYDRFAQQNEKAVAWLRSMALSATIIAAVLGASATTFHISSLSPWIGVVTTLGTSITAYGLMERRQYLAASYGAMVLRLSHIQEDSAAKLPDLVNATENLLQGEQLAWIERMTKTIPAPSFPPKPPWAAGR